MGSLHIMNKKLLSIITSVSLTISAFSFGANAAPSLVGITDTAQEYIPDSEIFEEETVYEKSPASLTGPSPVLLADSAEEINTQFDAPLLWDGAVLMAELSGDGTEQSPYLISSADELKLMANNVNSGTASTAHYKLTSDIDLGGAEWTPIGNYNSSSKYDVSFGGVFDGDGHTISNFVITKDYTAYIGLFGLVAGGTIKNVNIDNASININSKKSQKFHAGILAGRVLTPAPESHSSIINCNITGSSLKLNSLGIIFAGGIAGTVFTENHKNANIFISFVNSECDIDITTSAVNQPDDGESVITAGGLVGFVSAQTNTSIAVINSSAKGNVRADTLNTIVVRPMAGGAFANISTVDTGGGGTITIDSCYSQGTVLAESDYFNYVAGGFAAQFYATKNLFVKDCYSSSDVSGRFLKVGEGCEADPSAGGFVGQIFTVTYGQTIKRCYASGNVIDLSDIASAPKDENDLDFSYVGGFTGYSQPEGSIFEDCYRFEAQTVVGSDILEVDYSGLTALSEEDSKLSEKYVGFDMENVWEINIGAEYSYPTLREKTRFATFFSDSALFTAAAFGDNGKVTEPERIPSKYQTVDKVYSFSHWSLTKDGTPFDFENTALSESASFHAVFSSVPRQYTVNFMSGANTFVSQKLDYGDKIDAPSEIPTMEDTNKYYYTFLHWSDTENGEKFDFDGCTVLGNLKFYAVFEATDKSAWIGEVAESFNSGFGTETLPYIITTGEEFALFAKVINEQQEKYVNAHYALGANINLGGNYWVPIGTSEDAPFSGSFDGRGYSVSNFNLAESKYTGVFGYVLNGTIKNLAVNNFTIDLSPTTIFESSDMYVGGIAGYVSAKKGSSTLSGVCVSQGTINIAGKVENLYVGNIAGFAHANTEAQTSIVDSYAANDITAVNYTGYNYIGGLVGELHTGSSSLSQILRCYSVGTLNSESYHSSHAGGLVGYLYSYGSAFAGGSTSSEDDAAIMASDIDIMIRESFAITSVYSLSTGYTSYAGRITSECNTHAGTENVFYPRGAGIVIEAQKGESTKKTVVDSTGVSTVLSNLKSMTYLSESRGFDFENVWAFTTDFDYPVLKCMVVDKPVLKLVNTVLSDGTLDITLQMMSKYTLMIGIYNERNQLIKFERINYVNTGSTQELTFSYDNMDNAHSIALSAYANNTLTPLFDPIKELI